MMNTEDPQILEPVQAGDGEAAGKPWSYRLMLFLRAMAGVSLCVVWLTSVISMAAVELLFPQIYGGNIWIVMVEVVLLGTYLWLALMAAREQPG
ncbi:MAG: hypothetical protein E6G74_05180 [Alphaproteobacteria bacterium]|nr:MAG: hypothetical protein E6G74_05180 [Alphaproteobacteria bacterium]